MRALLAIGALLLAGLVMTVAILARGATLPWLTDRLAAEASEALGREVRIASAPYIKLGGLLQLRLRDVQIANSAWAGEEPLAVIGEADVVLQTGSLFSDGPLVFERIRIDGLHLRLARNEQGHSNLPQPSLSAEVEDPDRDGAPGLPFLLRDLALRDLVIEQNNQALDKQLDLRIVSLRQQENSAGRLTLDARGSLQGESWSLSGSNSGLQSLIEGEGLKGGAEAQLADLSLTFEYRLASIRRLEDLVLNARLTGTPPERVAALTPLLSPTEPLAIDVAVSDINPGIGIEAVIDLGDSELRISGSADDPGSGDGLNLSIDVDVASLDRLARALHFGATTDTALTVDGTLRRRGRRLELDDFVIRAGEHRIEGRIILPRMPGTTDARARLNASGPDFGFYQRLLERPVAINAPYTADVLIEGTGDDREAIEVDLQVNETRLRASGTLGDFPGYHDTQLSLDASIADLGAIGRTFDLALPSTELSIVGDVAVTEQGRVLLSELRATAAGIDATLDGGFASYPELDDIDLTLRASSASLARTSHALQGPALGELPVSFDAAIHGSFDELVIDALEASIGDSRVRTVSGDFRIAEAGLGSDLHLAVYVQSMRAMLGELTGARPALAAVTPGVETAPHPPSDQAEAETGALARLPDHPFSFELISELTPERIALTVTKLEGLSVRGELHWESGIDFAPDESMHLSADLTIAEPGGLLPSISGYSPPSGSLDFRADTTASPRRITARLLGDDAELLKMELVPRTGTAPATLHLRGESPDLRALGEFDAFPEGALPYHIDARASLDEGIYDMQVEKLSIAGSQLRGTARWQPDQSALTAKLDIPRADLGSWLPARGQPSAATRPSDARKQRPSRKERVIPAIPLPLEWLDTGALDLDVTTGALGLPDPQFPNQSLVERARFSVVSGDRRATLQISELRGSRGNLVLDAEAERTADGVRLRTDWQIDNLPIGMLTDTMDPNSLPAHRIDAQLTAKGATVRGLADTLDGQLLLTGEGGELNNLNLSLVTESFLEQLFSTLLPVLKTDTPSLKVECSVVGLRAKEGVVALDPGFVIRTNRVDLSARGAVDLSTERLTIRFDNQARTGLGISAASLVNPYVQITGTLARPLIGLDITGSALAGGAAVATGGLTILAKPLFGRFLQRKSPCDVALERWEKGAATSDGGP